VQNLTAQKVVIALFVMGFFILAPWMTIQILNGNKLPFLFLFGAVFLLLFIFGLKDRCWLIIPFSLPIEGRLNFLPLNFSMQETAIILVVAYFLVRIAMGYQIKFRLGPKVIWLPLLGLLAIFAYHWIGSGDIGIKALGGTSWGARKYFSIFLAVATIPILSSFSGASWNDFQKVPFLFFLGVFADLIPDTITTLAPATAPYIFQIYSAVNIGAYGSELMGNFTGNVGIIRFTPFRILGQALCLLVFCYFPSYTWLNPARFWVVPMLILGFFACAFSGFRAAIFNLAVISSAALLATARTRVILLLPIAAAGALLITSTQGNIINYPENIQRSLSFLPGAWNKKASSEGDESNKWRERIRQLFFREYFYKAPWLGTGFSFNPEYAKKTTELFLRMTTLSENDSWSDVRSFIELKQPHEGDIFALLTSGIIGTCFFVAFCLASVGFALKSVFKYRPADVSPVQIWALAILIQQSAAFFSVFGDYWMTLSIMCPVISILVASETFRPKSLELGIASVSAAQKIYPYPLQFIRPNYAQDPTAHHSTPYVN
jgi:hypothetical protein